METYLKWSFVQNLPTEDLSPINPFLQRDLYSEYKSEDKWDLFIPKILIVRKINIRETFTVKERENSMILKLLLNLKKDWFY